MPNNLNLCPRGMSSCYHHSQQHLWNKRLSEPQLSYFAIRLQSALINPSSGLRVWLVELNKQRARAQTGLPIKICWWHISMWQKPGRRERIWSRGPRFQMLGSNKQASLILTRLSAAACLPRNLGYGTDSSKRLLPWDYLCKNTPHAPLPQDIPVWAHLAEVKTE